MPIARRFSRHLFLAGMIGAVALATAFPDAGGAGGWLHGDALADAGIFVVFLLHGLTLVTARIRAGMLRWRLHLLVQAFTFGVFPVLGVVLAHAFGRWIPGHLLLGFLYLSALPSTISSSVAMTGIARGNVPGAIFNAVASNLLGVFLTPLLVGLVAGSRGQGEPLSHAILSIAGLILLPFLLGQALRPWLGAWFVRHERHTTTVDKGVILLLVYVAFCEAVRSGLWRDYGIGVIGLTLAGAGVFLATVLVLTTLAAGWLGFEKEDEIAAVFCGSKKALSSGVAMAKLIFGAHAGLGLVVLPVMFYHQLQLFVCSALAERYARRQGGAGALPPA